MYVQYILINSGASRTFVRNNKVLMKCGGKMSTILNDVSQKKQSCGEQCI